MLVVVYTRYSLHERHISSDLSYDTAALLFWRVLHFLLLIVVYYNNNTTHCRMASIIITVEVTGDVQFLVFHKNVRTHSIFHNFVKKYTPDGVLRNKRYTTIYTRVFGLSSYTHTRFPPRKKHGFTHLHTWMSTGRKNGLIM